MFGTTGGSGDSPARYPMAANQGRDRLTRGYASIIGHHGSFWSRPIVTSGEACWVVGGQDMTQHWQSGVPMCDELGPDWNNTGDSSSTLDTRADKQDQTPHIPAAMGHNDQHSYGAGWSPSGLGSEPVLPNPQSALQDKQHPLPIISIKPPSGECGVSDSGDASAWSSYPYATATRSTSPRYYTARSEVDLGDRSGLHPSLEGYGQASSYRRCSTGSIASAPDRIQMSAFDHTVNPAECCGWPSPSESSK